MLRRLSFRVKLLAGFGVLVLVAGSVLAYQLSHREPPSFRRGGMFATGALPSSAETTTTSAPAASDASSTSSSAPATTTSTAAPAATTAPKGTKASTTTTGPPVPGSATGSAVTTAQPPATAPPAQPSAPAGPKAPAVGTYTYAVQGQEKPSFFSARQFPDRMTTVVHGGGPGLTADQLVFDLRYSEEHEEREIVGFRDDGIYFDFEGGSVTFGPRTETNEGDYQPPLLQVPRRLEAGFTRSGTTQVKRSDGSVSRTEDWTVKVVGKEALTVAGATVETWKVETDRKSRPGGAETNNRQRTYWYDPARAMWVRFVDVLHGGRTQGPFTFTYDSTITATLLSFSPS